MDLRATLENNPVIVVGALIIATATLTSAAAVWHYEQVIERVKSESEVSSREVAGRLAGIERRLGGGDIAYFDLTRLLIPRLSTSGLGENYVNIQNGSIFVDVPRDSSWRYSLVSEDEIARLILPDNLERHIASVPLTAESNAHLWRGAGSYAMATPLGEMTFTPLVFVQAIENSRLPEAAAQIALNRFSRTNSALSQEAPSNQANTKAALDALDHWPPGGSFELERALSNIIRANGAAIQLAGFLNDYITIATWTPRANLEIGSIEKRDNILYAHVRLTQAPSAGARGHAIVIDSELFVVSMPTHTIFVKSIVPSEDGRSEAHRWVSQFLAGLRIPREAA